MKHTPGPWTHEISTNKIVVLNGKRVEVDLEYAANARLIASAPELLFYLKDLIEQVNQFPQIAKGINMTYAKQAIAKAEGVE